MTKFIFALGLGFAVVPFHASADAPLLEKISEVQDVNFLEAVNSVLAYSTPGMHPARAQVIEETLQELWDAYESKGAGTFHKEDCLGMLLSGPPKNTRYERILFMFKQRFQTAIL